MNFVNNWSQAIALAAGATSADLDLPDGTYRLTLADSAASATRWEIVTAVVTGGVAELARGQELTDDQEWPEGSVIYCSLTAGVLGSLLLRIEDLETAVADLATRVVALDGIIITSPSGPIWGYSFSSGVGAISPGGATVYPDGTVGGNGQILELAWGNDFPYYGTLQLRVSGGIAVWPDAASLPFETMTIGTRTFNKSALIVYDAADGLFAWESVSPNPFAAGPNKIAFS
ncbi:hypothetical protein [Pseudomonas indica]|uniref:hypothetical protein n=1 Tax=Pseudomonas indica TaxID=137658 RepID=UPI003FD64DEC